MDREPVLPYLWMLSGSTAFAVMGTLTHALGGRCDWRWMALARCLLPLVLVVALALVSGVRLVFWRPRTLWVRSLAGSISMLGTFFALTRLPVSDVFTLTNMFPVWVAALSWPLLGELPPGHVWLSVASGVAGVVLIQRPHLAEGNFAVLVALAASFFTALAMIGLHRLRGVDARAIVVHFSAVALLLCLACFVLFEPMGAPTEGLDGGALPALLGIGLLATVGQLFLTKAFAAGHPAKVSVVGLSQIVLALILDVLFLGHRLDALTLLGIVLVMAPTAWLMAYPAWLRQTAEPSPGDAKPKADRLGELDGPGSS
ncbi:MAG TPA: DMT family transporter [Gemmataceae bacterium]|nr:DMT family transporter [Gemmataceae bacterium]